MIIESEVVCVYKLDYPAASFFSQSGVDSGQYVGPSSHVLLFLLHPSDLGRRVFLNLLHCQVKGEGCQLETRDTGQCMINITKISNLAGYALIFSIVLIEFFFNNIPSSIYTLHFYDNKFEFLWIFIKIIPDNKFKIYTPSIRLQYNKWSLYVFSDHQLRPCTPNEPVQLWRWQSWSRVPSWFVL